MKFTKYFMPLAAVALLASCSNDKLDAPEGNPGGDVTPVEGTYLSFNIALPAADGTRDSNGGYDDGSEVEYGVHDVNLYIYGVTPNATDLTNADLLYVKEVGFNVNDDDSSHGVDAVTKEISVTFQLNDLNETTLKSKDYYVLAVVNKPISGWTAPSIPTNSNTGDKYSVVFASQGGASGRTVANIDSDDEVSFDNNPTTNNDFMPVESQTVYFTMTNAPLLVAGTSNSIEYLQKLVVENFAKSPQAAQEAAATIPVQRVVAKVQVDKTNIDDTDLDIYLGEDKDGKEVTHDKAKVEINGWALNITNKKAYAIQHVEEVGKFEDGQAWGGTHFLSKANIAHNLISDGKHIYWSIDPNYDTKWDKNQNNNVPNTEFNYIDNNTTFNTLDQVEYCLENTMGAQYMQKNQTTHIVFQGVVKFKKGDTEEYEAKDFVMYPGTDLICAIESDWLSDTHAAGETTIAALISDKANQDKVVKALNAANANEPVLYYPGGVTHYQALLRHFDDDETQWTAGATVDDLTKYEDKHTGRYGLVRNNSYVAKVGKVYGYGSPTIPTDPEDPTPDDGPDPIKYNVKLDLKVLAWTKRTSNGNMTIK